MSEGSVFVYVSYIRTTPERLWSALTQPEFQKQYWFGATIESDWSAGAPWRIVFADGRVADTGEILECDPLRRVVIKWRNEFMPELKAEGYTRCTIELEEERGAVKLTIRHEIDVPQAKFIDAVSDGWPSIVSNLKSLLETGAVATSS